MAVVKFCYGPNDSEQTINSCINVYDNFVYILFKMIKKRPTISKYDLFARFSTIKDL